MKTFTRSPISSQTKVALALVCLAAASSQVHAAAGKKNPVSKAYVADLNGQAQVDTGDKIEDLAKRSVFNAQGTVIETKPDSNNSLVFSNGTGSFFDKDTRVEVKRFAQEPFTPNRNDMDVEPSISQTRAFVARGSVALCLSKLVAGSNMTYATAHGSINVRAKRVVVEAGDRETKISIIEGESTVKGGDLDLGGQTLKAGQQAIIRPGAQGQPSSIQIGPIPDNERPALEEKVTMACMAKKTVYFEVRERQVTTEEAAQIATGNTTTPSEGVTAFDDTTDNSNRTSPINLTPGAQAAGAPPVVPVVTTVTEIVPVPVVPEDNTTTPVSASRLTNFSPSPL
jgi:hypothetical protein